jgi:hypothetical protein
MLAVGLAVVPQANAHSGVVCKTITYMGNGKTQATTAQKVGSHGHATNFGWSFNTKTCGGTGWWDDWLYIRVQETWKFNGECTQIGKPGRMGTRMTFYTSGNVTPQYSLKGLRTGDCYRLIYRTTDNDTTTFSGAIVSRPI